MRWAAAVEARVEGVVDHHGLDEVRRRHAGAFGHQRAAGPAIDAASGHGAVATTARSASGVLTGLERPRLTIGDRHLGTVGTHLRSVPQAAGAAAGRGGGGRRRAGRHRVDVVVAVDRRAGPAGDGGTVRRGRRRRAPPRVRVG
ncbi:hypothetical protein GCM10025868_23650 [Angustibacter aerolatus]|uniref:Uncharacterized protein n=1 Tax=Angustibacter aerolatus TaxID=1162965 RepID=A0ABQ6JJY6_9ACTN|nr:hypothetical protein GCM10025868_23650 [Angustibacter aerolatus]